MLVRPGLEHRLVRLAGAGTVEVLLLHLLVELQLRAQVLPELTPLLPAGLLDLLKGRLGLSVLLLQKLDGVHPVLLRVRGSAASGGSRVEAEQRGCQR